MSFIHYLKDIRDKAKKNNSLGQLANLSSESLVYEISDVNLKTNPFQQLGLLINDTVRCILNWIDSFQSYFSGHMFDKKGETIGARWVTRHIAGKEQSQFFSPSLRTLNDGKKQFYAAFDKLEQAMNVNNAPPTP